MALFAYLVADALVRALPARIADRVARIAGGVAFLFCAAARRHLQSNHARLERRPAGAARARAAFEHFGVQVADFLRLGHLDRDRLVARTLVHGREHLEAARRSGRGVILLTAHVGNWEWGAAYLALHGTRLHVAARAHAAAPVERFFRGRRARWGIHHLDGRPLWIAAAMALRRGGWVALMGDRAVPGFAGSLCAWASALARRTGAVILPAGSMRLADGRHVLCFGSALTPRECLEGGYRAAMLRHIRRAPEQWFAFEALPEGLA